jgi:predicted permease
MPFFQDLRYAFRQMRKVPGFTLIAVATLALGIGVNTALFSVISGVLLRPLPFHHADELVAIHENKPNFEGGSISYPNFRDWQKENHTFSAMAIARGYSFNVTGTGEPEQVNGEFISSDFFALLGVRPVLGRTFVQKEDEIGAAPVALVGEGFWKRKLESDPNVLNRSITLDGRSYSVVGVVPASFHLLIPGFRESALYVPIGQWNNNLLKNRGAGLGIHGIGRLKPNVSIAQATADMNEVTRNLALAYPDSDKGISAKIVPLKAQMVGNVRPILMVLLAAVGFVLLIACVNVANLLLARSTARSREFGVRVALGASNSRLFRQLLTESMLLAVTGGAAGLLLASWITTAVLGVLPTALPRAENIGIDTLVLLVTLGLSLLVGVLFGIVPAVTASRTSLHQTLKQGGRGALGFSNRTQKLFVVAEMSMALVLLIGAGLMIRSLSRLWNVDPGFTQKNVLTFGISLPSSLTKAKAGTVRATLRELDATLESTPGVSAVSQTWGAVPMAGDDEQLFWVAGEPKPASENEMKWAIDYIVGPDYLKVMGIPLRTGRFITPQDDQNSPRVVVVDEVFARSYFPGQDPVGKRINLNNGDAQVEIVGVVGHVKQWGLDLDDSQSLRAQFYIPAMQMPDAFIEGASATGVLIRLDGSIPESVVMEGIRRAIGGPSSQQVIFGTQTMASIISDTMAQRRFSMILLGAFAALALVLSSVGIYGVISYVVARRTQEIGIRMALGAKRADVVRMVLMDGTKLAFIGVCLGVTCALGLTRLMSKMLYGVTATDPVTFIAIPGILLIVAVAACYVPALRAMRVDPVIALRYD